MIFFLNLNGTCTRQDTDHIYQGSNNASKVIAITGISPAQTNLKVAFTLPNGLTVGYRQMQSKGTYQVGTNEQAQTYVYELDLPYNVTEVQGSVGVSFNVVNSITGANMTSYTNSFEVEYSALPTPPSSATESEIEQILNLLEAYVAENSFITEKVKNFHVGTVTAQASESGAEPQVTAEIVSESMPNSYVLNFDFTLPRGEQGAPGEITGAVSGVKGNAETEYRQGNVNLTAEDIGALPIDGNALTAQALARTLLTSADDLDNINAEGYYYWTDSAPTNSPCSYAMMILMWASSNNYAKQIVFRQGSHTNANGQYTAEEIWMRSNSIESQGGWTDWVLIPSLRYLQSNFSNPNLLINGNFAINQRGQTIYTSNYTVDRWKLEGADVELDSQTITIKNTDSKTAFFYQKLDLEESNMLLGNTVTLSCRINKQKYSKTVSIPIKPATTSYGELRSELFGLRLYYYPNKHFGFTIDILPNSTIQVEWVKLEIGATATAFVPPNNSTELVKCQRFYQRIPFRGISGTTNGTTLALFSILYPVTMRTATQTRSVSKPITILVGSKFTQTITTDNGFYFSYQTASGGYYGLKGFTGLTANTAWYCDENDSYLILDAEI